MWNPKHSAKYVCRTGTSASSTARAGTSCEMERRRHKKFIKYTLDLFSILNYYIKKGRLHGHRYGKKSGRSRVLHREFAQEEMQEETCSWVFTTGSSVMRDSART